MYYSFPDSSLIYAKSPNGYLGELYIRALIRTPADTVGAQEWIVTNERDSAAPKMIKNLVGQKLFVLKPGQYMVDIQIFDVHDTASRANSSFPIIIKDFSRPVLAISDIEVASVINTEKGHAAFKKGSLNVVPNATLEYNDTLPELHLYTEVYNSNKISSNGFKVNYTVFDALKNEVFSVPMFRHSVAQGIVETISLPMDIVPSGAYFVQATVFAPAENPTDSASTIKKVYIINPKIPPSIGIAMSEDDMFNRSEFATMTEEQIISEYDKFAIIATAAEIDAYNSLSENRAKQKYLYRFWGMQDSDPATLINETLEDFRKNVAYANTYYSTIQQRDGWRTDRGRVLLKYGKPSEIERNDYNVEGRPYEIWTYNNLQGGAIFAFVDKSGHNNYRLVHSTARGETRDDRWMQRHVQLQNLNPNGGR
jgi:GWxTD domain-containing protein